MKRFLLLFLLVSCSRGPSASLTFGAAGPWKEGYGAMNRRGVELAQGVVDANCRLHGVANLYVAGSAVFATTGSPYYSRFPEADKAQLNEILRAADARDALQAQGVEPEPGSPEALGARIRDDVKKWREVITSAGIREN